MKFSKLKKQWVYVVFAMVLCCGLWNGRAVTLAAQNGEGAEYVVHPELVRNLRAYAAQTMSVDDEELFDKGITGVDKSMPSIGDVNVMVWAVEFADAPFDENFDDDFEKNFFGDGVSFGSENEAPYSLQEYYEQSSFGKLHIDGDIFKYTSSHERSYYDDKMDVLIEEVSDAYKADIIETAGVADSEAEEYFNGYLGQYDADDDKIIDGIYLYYAGGAEERDSQWYSYVSYYGEYPVGSYDVGSYDMGSVCVFGDYSLWTIVHETGHMLGLADYYDYVYAMNVGVVPGMSGIAAMDMMMGNIGDHNVFSKMLLGWIEPENVKIITGDIEKVQLSECQTAGECVIVLPEYDEEVGLYTEFYLICYREYIKNNSIDNWAMPDGGLCVYYVNATLNEEGTAFLHSSMSSFSNGTIPLIKQVHQDEEDEHLAASITGRCYGEFPWPMDNSTYDVDTCFFHEGDEFTPYTLPSSSFFGGTTQNEFREYTGITLKDISIKDGIASFSVGIEEAEQDYEVSYEVAESNSGTVSALTDIRVVLEFSTELSLPKAVMLVGYCMRYDAVEVRDDVGEFVGYLTLNMDMTPCGVITLNDGNNVKEKMEAGKNYTIVIPSGTLYDMIGNEIAEIRIEYSTTLPYPIKDDWKAPMATADPNVSTHVYIDEAGNGINLDIHYEENGGGISNFAIIKNYQMTEAVNIEGKEECFLNEKYSPYPLAGWKAGDGKWGLLFRSKDYYAMDAYYVIIDEACNILKKEEFVLDGASGEEIKCDSLGCNGAYFLTGSSIIIFKGEEYEKYILDMSELDKKVERSYLNRAHGDVNTAIAIAANVIIDGYSIRRIHIFDKDMNMVYYTDTFDDSPIGIGFIKYYDGRYYLGTNDSDAAYMEVLDSDFRLIGKYKSIRAISMGKFKGGFAAIGGSQLDLYIYDNNFNLIDRVINFPADAFSEIYAEYDWGMRIRDLNKGIYIDLAKANVEVENANVVELSNIFTLRGDNDIVLKEQMSVSELEEILDGYDYVLERAYSDYVTEDCVLAVTSENGLYTQYYYFVIGENEEDTTTTIYDGVDYAPVYNYEYYTSKYPEITGSALEYFVTVGMAAGHQASEEFNLVAYKSNYPDLGVAFGSDNTKYYMHYINNGKAEGRNATVVLVESETKYYGVEYADVYNYDYYINNNPDLKAAFGDNKAAALIHFANMGMKEGRQACENFGAKIYKFNYPELQESFGEDMVLYYHHYMDYGKDEGRNGATRDFSAYCEYEGVNYTPVYNYEDYIERNPDVFNAYGLDANAVLKHFVTVGMAEGRQGSDDFNYNIYRSNYPDLEVAFGENRAEYYHHYINSGYNEGRNAATSDYTSDTVYAGVDYADVYSYDYYVTANPDVAAAIGDNKIAILAHFVRNGMAEGRQGSAEFNVRVYMEKNPDLVEEFGDDLKAYYMHYVEEGKAAGRVAV